MPCAKRRLRRARREVQCHARDMLTNEVQRLRNYVEYLEWHVCYLSQQSWKATSHQDQVSKQVKSLGDPTELSDIYAGITAVRLEILSDGVDRLRQLVADTEIGCVSLQNFDTEGSADFDKDLLPWMRGAGGLLSLLDDWTLQVESGAAELEASFPCHVRFGKTQFFDADISNLQRVFGWLVVPGTREPCPASEWHFEHDDLVSVTRSAVVEACASGKTLAELPTSSFRRSVRVDKGCEGRVRRICGWNCRPDYVLVELGHEMCAWLPATHVELLAKHDWPG